MHLVDGNVILRYLLADNPTLTQRSRTVIEGSVPLMVPNEVIAEIVYVLTMVYDVERKKTADTLSGLFNRPIFSFDRREVVRMALEIFRESSMDIVDCLLCARVRLEGCTISTFDRGISAHLKRHSK